MGGHQVDAARVHTNAGHTEILRSQGRLLGVTRQAIVDLSQLHQLHGAGRGAHHVARHVGLLSVPPASCQ